MYRRRNEHKCTILKYHGEKYERETTKRGSENAASEGSSRQLDTFDLEKRRLKEIKRGN